MRNLSLILLFPFLIGKAMAGGGGAATGGALEITQHANNVELVSEVQNTTQILSEANKQLTEARKLVTDSATNLTKLPPEYAWVKDVASSATEAYRTYSTVQRIKSDIGNAKNWLERRVRSYQCGPYERVDSCVRKVARNVQNKRQSRVDDATFFTSSVERTQDNLSKLNEIAARGQSGDSQGVVDQLNGLQQQMGIIGASLHEINSNASEQQQMKMSEQYAKEDQKTLDQASNIKRYQKSVNELNYYREKAGLEKLDTSNDALYNTDSNEIVKSVADDISN